MSIESLKEQARRHEQKEDWEKALELYLQAIRKLDGVDEDPDIGLFNRVGDLEVRLGQVERAVEHYERAVDLYVESDLPNNAIAICKKVVRSVPARDTIYLKMGQIRAQQGFLPDARRNFLTYAERKQTGGDLEEAFRALVEFVELVPQDTEIRLGLARQLVQHDRIEEAVDQFTQARRRLILAGREEEVEAVEAQIRELDPAAELENAETIRAAGPEIEAVGTRSRSDWASGLSQFAFGGDDEADEEIVAEGLEDAFELAPGGDDDEDEDVEREEEEGPPLPMMDFGEGEEEDEASPAEAGAEAAAAPDGEAAEGGWVEDLPAFDLEEGEGGKEEEAEKRREAAVEESASEGKALDDPEELREEAERLLSRGDVDGAWPLLERAHQRLAEQGDVREAVDAVRRMTEERPDQVSLRQRMLEYAYRTFDDEVLREAYLGLAGALRRSGQPEKAQAVYKQVLDSDPENEDAQRALADLGSAGASRAASRPEVASSEEYVDLGAMILEDEGDEKSTRFVVAAEAPSGDEAADFAKMLSQFKEKVAENLDTDDVAAHYDLGTAYKEMGLVDEAIAEFQSALRAARGHLPTYEMLGQCFLEKGQGDAAVRTLQKALDSPWEIEDELLGIYYYLGRAHEQMGKKEEALEFYDKVFALDINFMDVTERLRVLR